MPALSTLLHDDSYNHHVRRLRKTVASIRRRGFIGAMTRWYAESRFSGQPIHGAEVGVKYGGFCCDVLQHCPFIEAVYCIDPWEVYPADHPDRGRFGYANRDKQSWDWLYKRACEILSKHAPRPRVWRTYSTIAARELVARGEQLHYSYLDARHAYPDVLEDCREWWEVVIPGGLLCGDDHYPAGHPKRETTGVSQAVDDFAASVGLPVLSHHRSWFIERPV